MFYDDEFFMRLAIAEAQKAFSQDEVPVGAVLVYQNEVIASAYNLVESSKDATSHAEILCIKKASVHLDNWRLKEATLYCTLEPCTMCAGALISSRISALVWGAPDIRQGAHGSWINILDAQHPIHNFAIRKNVLQKECAQLMTEFFQLKRSHV